MTDHAEWRKKHLSYETRFNDLLREVAREVATSLMSDHEKPAIRVQMWEPDMYITFEVAIDRSPSFPRAPKVDVDTLEEVQP